MASSQLAEQLLRIYAQRLGIVDELQHVEHAFPELDIRHEVIAALQAIGQLLLSESGRDAGLTQDRLQFVVSAAVALLQVWRSMAKDRR